MTIRRHYIGIRNTKSFNGDQFRCALEMTDGIVQLWDGGCSHGVNNTKSFDEGEKLLKQMYPLGLVCTGVTVIKHTKLNIKMI